jgi:hypothetical protein
MRRVCARMCATRTHATALARVGSKFLAQRPSHAKVFSTTQRPGKTSKPLALSEHLMISNVHEPLPFTEAQLCPKSTL